jgi:phage virion morphogenesis protein
MSNGLAADLSREIIAKVNFSTPLLNDIGETLKRSITKNFQDGGRHNGQPQTFLGGSQRWQDLAPSTKKARIKVGKTGDVSKGDAAFNILVQKSILKNSITYRTDGKYTLYIGTNVVYGAIHHFGGMAGRGRRVKIPARPWLVIQERDFDVIRSIVADNFS